MKHRRLFLATVSCVLLVSILSVWMNYQIQFVIDAVTRQDVADFYRQMGLLVGIIIVLLVIEYGRQVWNVTYLNRVGAYFHQKSLYSAMAQGISFLREEQIPAGNRVSEINNDIEMVKELHYDTQISMIQGLASFLFSTVALLYLDVWVAIAILMTMGLPIAIPILFRQALTSKQERISQTKKTYVTFLTDLLMNQLAVKNSQHHATMLSEAEKKYDQMNDATLMKERQRSLVNVLVGLGFYATLVVILLIGGLQVLHGSLTLGALMSIFSISQELTLPANLIADSIGSLQSVSPIYQALISKKVEAIQPSTGSVPLRSIHVKHLTLAIEGKAVFEDRSWSFEQGNKYLITGASGRGKSLLTFIITNNLTDYTGEVSYNDEEWDYLMIQAHIGYLPQQATLFHDSIWHNLTYYGAVSPEAVLEGLHRLGLDDRFPTIASLDEVYNENSSLSGGQIQRLVLLRHLLEGKKWLVIDEGLSGLDHDLYRRIETTLLEDDTLTLIHVTHRPESMEREQYEHMML